VISDYGNKEDESVAVYMTRADAWKAADLLDASNDEDGIEIAANIRFQAKYNKKQD
jgi:hypothetical protein